MFLRLSLLRLDDLKRKKNGLTFIITQYHTLFVNC